MTSDENSSSPPIKHLTTGTSPIEKHTESRTQVQSSSTIIPITSNPTLSTSTSSVRPSDNHSESPYVSIQKKVSAKEIPISYLRHRLCVREFFIARLTLVSNIMSFLAILGIVLMIIENELTFRRVDDKNTKVSWSIKLIITITTAILLVLILYYHHLDMSLYALRNLLEDWRVQLTTTRILLIALEILICAIHPVPRSFPQSDQESLNLNSAASNLSSQNPYSLSYTAVDVGLGLPMFFRLYLLGRSIMLHSDLVHHLSLRSIGYLNHVSIDVFFLMKTYLEQWPTPCLITFCAFAFFIGSWSLRACDYTTTREHVSMSDSMWLFVVTFTTIGYGDQYPSTYCGRSVAAIIGLIGLLLSALLIALLAQKLLLTREEKYVHTFVLDTKLAKKHKHQAANIIKFAVKAWYLKRRGKSTSIQCFQAQRKLFRSIDYLQQIRKKQRNLVDSCVGFTEVMTTQRNTIMQNEEIVEQITTIKAEVKNIKEELNTMNRSMDTLQNTLNVLLEKVAK